MEREHLHERKHDDDALSHDDRGVGHRNQAAMLHAPEHPVASGLIARKADRDGNGVEHGADQAIATAATSSGTSLPSTIMRKFESSLGADLSGVRVHTGAESQTAASAVGAKAYTMGQDIHFGAGHYDPSSSTGEHLLAHEVAHTVQQSGGATKRQNKLEVSTPFDPAEHEADSAASAMVSGQSFQVGGGSGIQREAYAPEATEEKKSNVEAGSHFEIPLPKLVDMELAWAKLEVAGSISGDLGDPDVEGEEKARGEVGPTVGAHGIALGGEWNVTKERLLKIDGWTITSSPVIAVADVNKKEGKAQIAGKLSISNAYAPWLTLTAQPSAGFGGEWAELKDKAKKGQVGPGIAAKLTCSGSHSFDDFKVTISSSADASLMPNWGYILRQLAEKAAEQNISTAGETAAEGAAETAAEPTADVAGAVLTAEVLVPAAIVSAGLITIAAALYQISKSDEFTERTEPEVQKLRAYCLAYQQAMRGEPMTGGDGAGDGYTAGTTRRQQLESSAPGGQVAAAAQHMDIYSDAWNKGWPPVKAKMVASYWDEHYIEHALYGDAGIGGGFPQFKMLIDGFDYP